MLKGNITKINQLRYLNGLDTSSCSLIQITIFIDLSMIIYKLHLFKMSILHWSFEVTTGKHFTLCIGFPINRKGVSYLKLITNPFISRKNNSILYFKILNGLVLKSWQSLTYKLIYIVFKIDKINLCKRHFENLIRVLHLLDKIEQENNLIANISENFAKRLEQSEFDKTLFKECYDNVFYNDIRGNNESIPNAQKEKNKVSALGKTNNFFQKHKGSSEDFKYKYMYGLNVELIQISQRINIGRDEYLEIWSCYSHDGNKDSYSRLHRKLTYLTNKNGQISLIPKIVMTVINK